MKTMQIPELNTIVLRALDEVLIFGRHNAHLIDKLPTRLTKDTHVTKYLINGHWYFRNEIGEQDGMTFTRSLSKDEITEILKDY